MITEMILLLKIVCEDTKRQTMWPTVVREDSFFVYGGGIIGMVCQLHIGQSYTLSKQQ